MVKIISKSDPTYLSQAAGDFLQAKNVVALTGAGISVESGIDDFRSPGGLWSRYPVEEYGTIEVFRRNPQKAWQLFRLLGRKLHGKQPNDGHKVLANLEKRGLLQGVVTQNIDNLHQAAGSRTVVEIHGDHLHLHCIGCGYVGDAAESILEDEKLPECSHCGAILKPNVVLFGEQVRYLDAISVLLHQCDLLLVVGTSAQVYPAAALPQQVKMQGGKIYEFNTVETCLTTGEMSGGTGTDYFFKGSASTMLNMLFSGIGQ